MGIALRGKAGAVQNNSIRANPRHCKRVRAAAALPVTRATPQRPSDVSGLGVEMRDRPAGNPSRADDVDAGQHSGTVERQPVASELKTECRAALVRHVDIAQDARRLNPFASVTSGERPPTFSCIPRVNGEMERAAKSHGRHP